MKVLAIDQSLSSSGVVLFQLETEEMLDYKLFKSRPTDAYEFRIIQLTNNIIEYIEEQNPDFVVLEGLALNTQNSRSARPLAGLFYVLLSKLIERGISFEYYPPMEIKKFMAKHIENKNAKSKKEELGDAFVPEEIKNEFLKISKKTTGLYDLCDAYAIGRYKIFLENPVL